MLKSRLSNIMISIIEYCYLNVTTANHQSQSQKHQSLIKKPSESRAGTKLVEKIVLFAMHAKLQYTFSSKSTSPFLQSSLYNGAAI